jgi:hypothetical protein
MCMHVWSVLFSPPLPTPPLFLLSSPTIPTFDTPPTPPTFTHPTPFALSANSSSHQDFTNVSPHVQFHPCTVAMSTWSFHPDLSQSNHSFSYHLIQASSTFHPCPTVQILIPYSSSHSFSLLILQPSSHTHSNPTNPHPLLIQSSSHPHLVLITALCHPHPILHPSSSNPFLSSSYKHPTFHLSLSYICLPIPNPPPSLIGRSRIGVWYTLLSIFVSTNA